MKRTEKRPEVADEGGLRGPAGHQQRGRVEDIHKLLLLQQLAAVPRPLRQHLLVVEVEI